MKEKHTDEQPFNPFTPPHFNPHTVPVVIVAELNRNQFNALLKALHPSVSTDIKQ